MLAKFLKISVRQVSCLLISTECFGWILGILLGIFVCFFQDESKKAAYDSSSPFEEI